MFISDKDLFKEVKKVKLSDILPKFTFPPGYDHAVVDSDNNILNFCSKRYNLIPNLHILEPIEMYFQLNKIEYIRRGRVINNSKFYVDYIIKTRKDVEGITGIFPKISICNSYDGVSQRSLELGFYRLIGSNHFSIISEKFGKHTISRKEENNDMLIMLAKIRGFIDASDEYVERFYKTLADKKINSKLQVTIIGKNVGLSKKIIESAKERYVLETNSGLEYTNEHGEMVIHSGNEETMFAVYCALNHAIYNTNLKELPEKKIEKDRNLIAHFKGLGY